ncbi:MAG: ABC transporter permease subunit [Actinomycetaceae bacterium]|nr:ABC transporter permease subunit [Actinomycetaceae bacterium]
MNTTTQGQQGSSNHQNQPALPVGPTSPLGAAQAVAHPGHGASPSGQNPTPFGSGQRLFDPRKYRSRFSRLVTSELHKITSLRSMHMTVIIMFALLTLIVGLTVRQVARGSFNGQLDAELATFLSFISMVCMLVIGALAVTGEYASNTMRTTALSTANRMSSFAAKCVGVVIVTGIATAALLLFLLVVAGLIVGSGFDLDASDYATLGRTWLLVVGFALMGTGLGYAIRSTAGTLTTLLSVLILSPLLAVIPIDFFRTTLNMYLPQSLANQMAAPQLNSVQGQDLLSPGTSTVVWLVYLAVILVLGAIRYTRRDI